VFDTRLASRVLEVNMRSVCLITLIGVMTIAAACGGSPPTAPTSVATTHVSEPPPTSGPPAPPPANPVPGPSPAPAPAPAPAPQPEAAHSETWTGFFTVETLTGDDQMLALMFRPASRLPMTVAATWTGPAMQADTTIGILTGRLTGEPDGDQGWHAVGPVGGPNPWPGAEFTADLRVSQDLRGKMTITVNGSWGTGTVSGPVVLLR
jgi:hypothetical protein